MLLVRGRCLLRALIFSEVSGFARKRRLGLGEPLVVVCAHGWMLTDAFLPPAQTQRGKGMQQIKAHDANICI